MFPHLGTVVEVTSRQLVTVGILATMTVAVAVAMAVAIAVALTVAIAVAVAIRRGILKIFTVRR